MAGIEACRVLVTGGTGFIGSHLVRRLVGLGAVVHVLTRHGSPCRRIEDVRADVSLLEGDLTEPASLEHCLGFAQPSVIFHLAAITDLRHLDSDLRQLDEAVSTNLLGTLNLMKAVQRSRLSISCFIRTGGIEEYGNGRLPFRESQREEPVSPYSASQAAATHFCHMIQKALGLPLVTLRPVITYGPAQSSGLFIPTLIAHCLQGKDFAMTTGDATRDLLYVADLVEALLRAATTPGAHGEIINVGSGQEYRILDVAQLIVKLCGSPIRLGCGELPPRQGGVRQTRADIRKAKNLLGWSPQVSLEEGLRQTIAWYRDQTWALNGS